MNQIRERFDETAAAAAPPSRLTADAVYAAAFRRRRRRATAWTACGAGVVAFAVAVAAGLLPAGSVTRPAHDPAPARTADGWPAGAHDGMLLGMAAADGEHLYATVNACTGDGTQERRCTVDLVGSDDGGRTWTVRWQGFTGELTAPTPGVLLRTVERENTDPMGPKLLHIPWVSRDGGRVWTEVVTLAGQAPRVPAGGWLTCAPPRTLDDPCALLAVDPVAARATPLAAVPDIEVNGPAAVPSSAGLWVTGWERGGAHLPAVAVSHDGGVTWQTHVFGKGEAGYPVTDMLAYPAPASVDGVTGYMIITVADPAVTTSAGPTSRPGPGLKALVYRTGDGGRSWQRVPAQSLPNVAYNAGDAYVAAGGVHVVLTDENPPLQWVAGVDGGQSYRRTAQPGLGGSLNFTGGGQILTVGPGAYFAYDSDALYRSSDGLQWTRVVIQVTR
ncbi:hypothetical protein [Dactylosporangium sp. NPDC005555]|uniref:WD40/YVTN/BNR-like repeat-containing protein n=1 Tax=Dactylosporangium sp. NPDC005555 TaxID=3154889 RepID=UPI0033BC62A3